MTRNQTAVLSENFFSVFSISLFSFTVMALEIIYFHLLLNVTDYLKANFIISMALLGIAGGSILGFYLLKLNSKVVFFFAGIVFAVSLWLSWINITRIGLFQYPRFLFLPFLSASVIISMIFSRTDSNQTYFFNLFASALGVILPVAGVPAFGSENCLIILCVVPFLFLFLLAFRLKTPVIRWVLAVPSLAGILCVCYLFQANTSLPLHIPSSDFESGRIMKNVRYKFNRDFLNRVYVRDPDGKFRSLAGDAYDKKRAKYILQASGYLPPGISLMNNLVRDRSSRETFNKIYAGTNDLVRNDSLIFSEDNLTGRIEFVTRESNWYKLAVNGTILDTLTRDRGLYCDPRVPWIKDPRAFIVGLSAHGIVKSVRKLKGSKVAGMEINPIIARIMTEDEQFSRFGRRPYTNTEVHIGEARSFLESNGPDLRFHLSYEHTCGPRAQLHCRT